MKELNIDILVNKANPLDLNYIPSNMYLVDENENNFRKYLDPNIKPMLRIEAKPFIEALLEDAQKEGLHLIIDSAYRSSGYQAKIFKSLIKEKGKDAYKLIASPGTSEHQTGLAIDFAYFKNGIYTDDVKEEDKEAIWLKDNAWKYGFILRYPKNKEHITGYCFEPWHYRFVGKKLATYLYQENITLEEYYQKNNVSN